MKQDKRKVISDFLDTHLNAYLEMVESLPAAQQPKTSRDLIGDFIEYLSTPDWSD